MTVDLSSLVLRPVSECWDSYFLINPLCLLGKNLNWNQVRKTIGSAQPYQAHGYVVVPDGSPGVRVSSEQQATELAEDLCATTARDVYLGKAEFLVGRTVVFRGQGRFRLAQPEQFYRSAVDAVDFVIQQIDKKATLDPGNPKNWHILTRRTADAMQATASGWEKRANTAARKYLDQNWPSLTKAEGTKAIKAASVEMAAIGHKAVPGISNVVSVEAKRVMTGRRKAAIRQFELNIGANLSLADNRAIEAQRMTSVSWITNEYGKRAINFEGQAKSIVERGLEMGHGRNEIGERLEQAFASQAINRSRSYYQVYAAALVSRSRSYAEVNAYIDASIEKCIAVAVMDDVTTDFCRFVDGKVLDVVELERVLSDADAVGLSPDTMKGMNPWVREATKPDGSRFMHAGGVKIADIATSGVGTTRSGDYKNAMPTGQMAVLGVGPPPYHGRCRTTTVPEISHVTQQVTVQKPVNTPSKLPQKPVPKEAVPSFIDSYGYSPEARKIIDQSNYYKTADTSPMRADYNRDKLMKAISKEDMKDIRQQVNAMYAREGITSADILEAKSYGSKISPEHNYYATASHSTKNGEIKFNLNDWKKVKTYATGKIPEDVAPSTLRMSIKTLVHEVGHEHSPVSLASYFSTGMQIEESTTEIVARYMTKKYIDAKYKKQLGSYQELIIPVRNAFHRTVSEFARGLNVSPNDKRLWHAIEQSSLKYKASFATKGKVDKGTSLARFKESIEIPDSLLQKVHVKDRPKVIEYAREAITERLRAEYAFGKTTPPKMKVPGFRTLTPATPKRPPVKVPAKTETPSMPVKEVPKLPVDLPAAYMKDKTAPGKWDLDDLRKAMEGKKRADVRKQLNSLFSNYGMVSKDIVYGRAGRAKINLRSLGGAAGAHSTINGEMYIARKTWTDVLQFLNGGDIKHAQAFGTLIHEGFHGHTVKNIYRGLGVNIEEMVTELGTRQVMKDMFGSTVAAARISYKPQIEAALQAFKVVDPALDVDDIMSMAGKAAIKTCKGKSIVGFENDYLRMFADGVDFPAKWTNGLSKAKASAKIKGAKDTLYKELSEQLAKVQPPK